MNIAQANAIPLSKILESLGHQPKRKTAGEAYYLSPLRTEKTASFKVDNRLNLWIDFGADEGGDVVRFVCRHLEESGEDSTVSDALRWIANMHPSMTSYEAMPRGKVVAFRPALKLLHTNVIGNPALIKWISGRGISPQLAGLYLTQANIRNVKQGFNFLALALKHENDGYELMNGYGFKGSINGKSISFIRGAAPNGRVHVFEGTFDYLSALTYAKKNRFEDDTIILNSVSNLKIAIGYIQTNPYNTVMSWLDNDEAGNKATAAIQEIAKEKGWRINPQNSIYAGHNDVNDWHRAKLGLK